MAKKCYIFFYCQTTSLMRPIFVSWVPYNAKQTGIFSKYFDWTQVVKCVFRLKAIFETGYDLRLIPEDKI